MNSGLAAWSLICKIEISTMNTELQIKTSTGAAGLRKIWNLISETFFQWFDDGVPHLGAALAFYTIFSAAPVSIIVIAVAGSIYGPEVIERGLLAEVERLVGPQTAEFLSIMIESARHSQSGFMATLLGFVTMFIGATVFFVELQDSLNRVWRAKVEVQRILWSLVFKRLLSFLMVLLAGSLLLAMLLANAILAGMQVYASSPIPAWVFLSARVSEMLISFLISSILFAAIYKILPDVRIAWRDVWVGAVVTSILFNVGRFLIGLYLGRESLASAYGAAGAFVALLLWVYYSAQVVLLGAEFTEVYARTYGKGFTQKKRRYLRPPSLKGDKVSPGERTV